MHVVVDTEGVRLERTDELDRFDVRRRGAVDVAGMLAEQGWGRVDETGDVLVDVARLRAAGPDDEGWRTGLDGMLAYAATKGWTDAAGTHVRAHVVDES